MPARRATVVAAVMRVTWQAWFNELARSVGSRRGARAMGGAILALLAAWLVVGTYALGSQVELHEGDLASIATPVTAVTFTLPALATLLCALYMPSRTVLHNTLAVLPVRPSDRNAAVRWLSVGLGLVLGGLWVAPLAAQFVTLGSVTEATGAVVVSVAYAVLGALAAQVVFLLLELALNRVLGHGGTIVTGIAGLGCALLLLWAMLEALPFQGGEGGGPFGAVSEPLRSMTDGGGLTALLDLGLLVAAGVALGLATGQLDRVPRRRGAGPVRRGRRAVRAPRTLLGLEVRQWARYPTNATMLVFTAGLSVAGLTLWRGSLDNDNWVLGAFFLFTLISTIGVGSFGPTRPMHWIYHVAGRPLAWVAPKLLSVVVIWLSLLAVYFVVLSALTSWTPTDGLALLPMLAVEVATGCVVGLLLPVNRQQSLSGALSETVAIVLVLSITVGVQSLPWLQTTAVYVVTCLVVAGGLVALYVAIARAQVETARRTGAA